MAQKKTVKKSISIKKRPNVTSVDVGSVRFAEDPNHLKPLPPIEKADPRTQLVILSFLLFVGVTCIVAGTILGLANLNKLTFLNRGSLPYFTLPEAISLKNSRFAMNETDYVGGAITNGQVRLADPYSVISAVIQGEDGLVLIDMRPADAFSEHHVKYSVSIPFPDSDEKKQEEFVKSVEAIAKGKRVVLLPYSAASTSGEQAYALLDKEDIEVSLMKQGWNELYNLPNIWVPEKEWQSFTLEKWVEFRQ